MSDNAAFSTSTGIARSFARTHRADVQGLRGVAVLLVVLDHAGVLRSGFIGVDVFFAISGFVVVRSLLTAFLGADDGVASVLGAFYKRRVARLAPAFALCVGPMALMAVAFAPIRALGASLGTALSGLLLTSNVFLYRIDEGYFDFASGDNAFLHLWSLSVEEQFYLLIPPILALCFWLRSGGRAVALAGFLAIALTGLSFWSSIDFTYAMGLLSGTVTAPEVFGFYSPLTRAWEFGVGATLALYEHRWRDDRAKKVWAALGFGLLFAGLVIITDTSPFPGWLAALPVLGTSALIFAGGHKALETGPLVWLGNLSYSWYLWHWPVIVFVRAWFPESVVVHSLAGAASLLPAWLSYRWVEQPLRIGSTDATPTASWKFRVSVAMGAVAVILAVSAGKWGGSASHPATAWQEQTRLHADVTQGCDASVTPPPGGECVWPPGSEGDTDFFLIGDSNAGHFAEALIGASERLGRRLELRTASGCPPGLAASSTLENEPDSCDRAWRFLLQRLKGAPPAVIVVGRSFVDLRSQDVSVRVGAREHFERLIDQIQGFGHTVILVAEVPTFTHWPAGACGAIRSWLGPEGACEYAVDLGDLPALTQNQAYLDELIRAHPQMVVIDFSSALCPDRKCSSHRAETLMWRDQTHLSVYGSEALVDAFSGQLSEVTVR